MHVDLGELARRKELAGGQERNRLCRATSNGAWLSAVPHRLNGTELYREEFRDNLGLRYGLMPQDIPATCDDCGEKFSIKHAISYPKGGLVLGQHHHAAPEQGHPLDMIRHALSINSYHNHHRSRGCPVSSAHI